MVAIGFLSYMVWGHHMFVSGMNPFSAMIFSVPTLIITIPADDYGVAAGSARFTARKMRFTTPALFCLGFISVFISGGISGFFLAQPSLDTYLHATYFVVGSFSFRDGRGAMFGIFAGTYFWFPKMFGRMMNETLGKWHFWLTFLGVYCVFMPMHYLGLVGNVRRYSAFMDDYLAPLIPVHRIHHDRRAADRRCPAYLSLESDLEPVPRTSGVGESLGGHFTRVGDDFAAALRQFRRKTSRCVSRTE